jgi:GTPase involved in cell partitioning and DNA repair
MHGRAAADVEIKVPLGTVIKHVCAEPHGYL